MLGRLRHVRGLEFAADVSYEGFLLRVKRAEAAAKAGGIWDGAPHPWLNLFVAKADIADFDRRVFKSILRRGVGGPMLVYPLVKSKRRSRFTESRQLSIRSGHVCHFITSPRTCLPFHYVSVRLNELVARERVTRSATWVSDNIARGTDTYGVTTGFGATSHRRTNKVTDLQTELIRFLNAGVIGKDLSLVPVCRSSDW